MDKCVVVRFIYSVFDAVVTVAPKLGPAAGFLRELADFFLKPVLPKRFGLDLEMIMQVLTQIEPEETPRQGSQIQGQRRDLRLRVFPGNVTIQVGNGLE